MKPVETYTSPFCGICRAAKSLLKQKSASYQGPDVTKRQTARQEMTPPANDCHTVRQINVGKALSGGLNDIYALDRSGKLGRLLAF